MKNNETNGYPTASPTEEAPPEVALGSPLTHDTSDFDPKFIPQESNHDDESQSQITAALGQAKETVRIRGQELLDRTGERAREAGDVYLAKTSSKVRNLRNALNSAEGRLNENQPEPLKDGLIHLSSSLDKVADYLENKDSSEIVDDARSVAREHPALVVGGLLMAGFVAGRMLRVGDDQKTVA